MYPLQNHSDPVRQAPVPHFKEMRKHIQRWGNFTCSKGEEAGLEPEQPGCGDHNGDGRGGDPTASPVTQSPGALSWLVLHTGRALGAPEPLYLLSCHVWVSDSCSLDLTPFVPFLVSLRVRAYRTFSPLCLHRALHFNTTLMSDKGKCDGKLFSGCLSHRMGVAANFPVLWSKSIPL